MRRFIVALALVCCSSAVGIAVTQTPAQREATPCCTVKSIDARTRMVTVTETKTGCTYEFQAKDAKDLDGLKSGGSLRLDVKQLPATSGPTGSTAQAATSGGSEACGSNVPRNAKTKTLCKVMTGPNSWEYRPC